MGALSLRSPSSGNPEENSAHVPRPRNYVRGNRNFLSGVVCEGGDIKQLVCIFYPNLEEGAPRSRPPPHIKRVSLFTAQIKINDIPFVGRCSGISINPVPRSSNIKEGVFPDGFLQEQHGNPQLFKEGKDLLQVLYEGKTTETWITL